MGGVRLGQLRRKTPFTRNFGFDRGVPIDRFYIEEFMRRHARSAHGAPGVIRGRVLEIGEDRYTSRFAHPGDVARLDILDFFEDNPRATIVADLASGEGVDNEVFDCIVCTQTLLLVYDVQGAVRTLHRILRPGGTVLATLPGISQICRPEADRWGDFWRFTTLSARRLFEDHFGQGDVVVEAYGNVLSATAFLYGLASEDLSRNELVLCDPDYEVTIGVRATKRGLSPTATEQSSP